MSAIVNADASDGDDVQVASLTLRRPIYCMAPMVGQSDRPFRLLCRRHGTTLCYSEMLMADEFAASAAYRLEALGDRVRDHPLIVQFAANEPDAFARAAVAAHAMGAAGADLNIGCPQRRAREGFYGSWMQKAAHKSSFAALGHLTHWLICAQAGGLGPVLRDHRCRKDGVSAGIRNHGEVACAVL